MSDESRNLIEEFDARYRIGDEPVMCRIEHAVMGSDYGATSYTTRQQADRLADLGRAVLTARQALRAESLQQGPQARCTAVVLRCRRR